MKDPEFIELLNLYLDHEISAEDAARLEAEVQSNPKRRRVYREYCCMQKACVVLAQQAAPAVEAEQRNVVAFEPNRTWGFGSYAAGLCAAAACVALVVIARNRSEPGLNQAPSFASQPAAGSQLDKKDTISPRSIAQTVSVVPRSNELKPVFTAASFALGDNSNESRTNEILPAADARFEWMNRVQVSSLTRVPAEDLVFDAKSAQAPESRTFVSHRPLQGQVEMSAFQFQR